MATEGKKEGMKKEEFQQALSWPDAGSSSSVLCPLREGNLFLSLGREGQEGMR